MISEQEIRTGEKSTLDRNLNAEQIMDLKEVKEIVNERVKHLEVSGITINIIVL